MVEISIAVTSILLLGVIFFVAYFKTSKVLSAMVFAETYRIKARKEEVASGEKFFVKSCEGFTLSGLVLQPNIPPKGIVVTCHNLGGSKSGMSRYARFLTEAGYTVVSFDFRDHGESEGNQQLKFHHLHDLEAIMQYVEEINHKNLPIGIFSLSMGTVAALLYASKNSNVKAVVADSGPVIYVEDYLNYIADFRRINNPITRYIFIQTCFLLTDLKKIRKDLLRAIPGLDAFPVLFIQGERDFMNPVRNVNRIMELMNSRIAESWIIEGANHLTGYSLNKAEYKDRVLRFLNKFLQEEFEEYAAGER